MPRKYETNRGPVPEANIEAFKKRMWWARWFLRRSKHRDHPWDWKDEKSAARYREWAQKLRSSLPPENRNTT